MGGPGIIDGETVKAVDNFLPSKFVVNGKEFSSAENYFQAQKSTNEEEFEKVRLSGPGMGAYEAGRTVKFLRPDWEVVKVRIMYDGNKAKFEQNQDLRNILLATRGPVTFSESSGFWCMWNARIIQLVREELRPEGKRDEDRIKELRSLIEDYEEKKKIELKK
eukprot:TRINITY_DN701_c0_g1_i1.p1 TRINITY_DN701_c0_g1~~TRINITY_DN701_c0_g1_i1.p1  ORF type:complete len:163 (-),score=53.00 TRINITY_DN701_c0_g1_i1:61-549(-)